MENNRYKTLIRNKVNTSVYLSEQHRLIIDTLYSYDSSTISIEEAKAIALTFTSPDAECCKAIYRYLLDIGFEETWVESIIDACLEKAIYLQLSEQQIQELFSALANLVMAIMSDKQLINQAVDKQQRANIGLLIENHIKKLD